ncbi:MAG TPA: zinc metallopeptidase [Firmicutes bacterium]|nr:zinc metallopeptidase [Bacillota bacterium]
MFWYDTTIILLIPAIIITIIAQIHVKSTFQKYSRVNSLRGYTGGMLAREILDKNGLYHIRVEHTQGHLTDHYDPRAQVIRLSDSVYNSTSVASLGVAAHEVGHAIQYKEDYMPIRIRQAVIPVTQIGSQLAFPLTIFGLIFSWDPLIWIGILLFIAVVFFQLVTLPVEFNASGRALRTLEGDGILGDTELEGAKKVLRAAAMTYVAALITALANLARLLALANRRER